MILKYGLLKTNLKVCRFSPVPFLVQESRIWGKHKTFLGLQRSRGARFFCRKFLKNISFCCPVGNLIWPIFLLFSRSEISFLHENLDFDITFNQDVNIPILMHFFFFIGSLCVRFIVISCQYFQFVNSPVAVFSCHV